MHLMSTKPYVWLLAVFASLLLIVECVATRTAIAHTILRDIEYAAVDGISLRLDLYLPDPSPQDPVPLVIWVHGGGWRAGSKNLTYAPETLGKAYAVASVDYRLTGIETFPAQIHDVKAAVRWLRAHAGRYGFDPTRFGAWGASAGGHLVALLGVSCRHPDLEGVVGEHLEESSCVQAVCDFYGPADLLSLMDQRGGEAVGHLMAEDLLLGGLIEETENLARLASPLSHISFDAPPFLIMHGSDDQTVPLEQSIVFDEALRKAGVDTTLIVIDGAGHGFPREHLAAVKPWFDAHLAPQDPVDTQQEISVHAFHRNGQTFLTWPEANGEFFAVYRAHHEMLKPADLADGELLWIVDAASSFNARASAVEDRSVHYVLHEGDAPLASDTGLYVHTTSEFGEAFYAIAACSQTGEPLEWIGSVGPLQESERVPMPVLQCVSQVGGSVRAHYVHWAPHIDTSETQALCNRPSQAFNFVVWEPMEIKLSDAAVFALHGGGGSYVSALPLLDHPTVTVIAPDSYVPGSPASLDRTWDAWYGYNENVGTDQPLHEALNVDYTTRRLRWMGEWLVDSHPSIDANRLFLRGSSMGGVGTVFSGILLRDVFAAGLAIVPRFDYGADDVFLESFDTFGTRWGSLEDNLLTSDGIGIFDRLDAGFLASAYPEWDFSPVWAFNGRNDTAVGWSEKIPCYKAMNNTLHGWAFFWDLRAHGGQAPFPRQWREAGWEDAIFDWMITNLRLDQSYPAFSNCSIDDDPGNGDPEDGDAVGTINGYLRWDSNSIVDQATRWEMDLSLHEQAPQRTCIVNVTPRRLQAFSSEPGDTIEFAVFSKGTSESLMSGEVLVDDHGLITIPSVSVSCEGVRLVLIRQ